MAKIAVFLAAGFEEIEALTVVDVCRRAGIEVATVSITQEHTVVSSHKIPVVADTTISALEFDALDMIVLPGGMPGTLNLEGCEVLMQQVDAFYAHEKFIAAICAAPSILGHRGMLKGKNACSYPSFESHLEGANVMTVPAVTDGKIITGRGMGAAIEFGLAIITALLNAEEAAKIASSIVYV